MTVLSNEQTTTTFKVSPRQISRNQETLTLREVDEDSVEFKNLVASIGRPRVDENGNQVEDHGLLNPICVRPIPGRPAGEYAIVDGLHRLTAWRKAFGDSKPIPVFVRNVTEEQALEEQMEANAHFKKTEYAEFANQVILILDRHPERSLEEQAARLSVEPNTMRQWLKLVALPPSIQDMVNKGTIPVSVGIPLARFKTNSADPEARAQWASKQKEWLDHYMQTKDEPSALQTWISQVAAAIKKIDKDVRDKKKEISGAPGEFTVTFTMRKKSELEIELKRTENLFEDGGALADVVNDPEFKELVNGYPRMVEAITAFGYRDALRYAGQVDEKTIAVKREAAAKREADKASKKEDKKAGDKADSVARATGQGLFALFGKRGKK